MCNVSSVYNGGWGWGDISFSRNLKSGGQTCFLTKTACKWQETFFHTHWLSVSWFLGSGVFLERRTLRDVVKQRAYVGKGERLFLGRKWSTSWAVLTNNNSRRDNRNSCCNAGRVSVYVQGNEQVNRQTSAPLHVSAYGRRPSVRRCHIKSDAPP